MNPRDEFAEILMGVVTGTTVDTAPAAVTQDTGPRAPRPNAAQGTSNGAVGPVDGRELFAAAMEASLQAHSHLPAGAYRLDPAEAGQHAGWSQV